MYVYPSGIALNWARDLQLWCFDSQSDPMIAIRKQFDSQDDRSNAQLSGKLEKKN